MMKITEPGIYRDFSEAAYNLDPCPSPSLSQSICKVMLDQSAQHAMLEHPRLAPLLIEDDAAEKYVKAMAVGNAAPRLPRIQIDPPRPDRSSNLACSRGW